MEIFRNFLFRFSWSSMMGEITLQCAKALPQSVPFLSLSTYYLVMTILFSGQNHVKSSTSSYTTARKHPDTCLSCIHIDTGIHREDEYISLIFLGNLAKQIITKRWSREVDLLIKQVVGGAFCISRFVDLWHIIVLAFGQQDISNTHTSTRVFSTCTAHVHHYQSSGISHFESRFPVKMAIHKYNHLNCFTQSMNVINCTLDLSVCQLL